MLGITSSSANSETFAATLPSDVEIRMTRRFDAPPQRLFDAVTRAEHVRKWWGVLDEDYSVPVCESDARSGGAWRFVSRHPWGETGRSGVYREVAPPYRLVFTQIFDEAPQVVSVVRMEFAEEGSKTRMTVTIRYPSIEIRDWVLGSGMSSVAAASYDRLEETLRSISA
jgi:uncharacterized protein YndB with AHSA1/START domain